MYRLSEARIRARKRSINRRPRNDAEEGNDTEEAEEVTGLAIKTLDDSSRTSVVLLQGKTDRGRRKTKGQ